jgi:hypothetical protein
MRSGNSDFAELCVRTARRFFSGRHDDSYASPSEKLSNSLPSSRQAQSNPPTQDNLFSLVAIPRIGKSSALRKLSGSRHISDDGHELSCGLDCAKHAHCQDD